MISELLQTVRNALRFIGAEVTERDCPVVVTGGNSSYYNIADHKIALPLGAALATLAHELAHSQQTNHIAPEYWVNGKISAAGWLSDTREIEAVAVEVIVPLMSYPKWAECAKTLETLGILGVERAKWARWLLTSSGNDAKPGYLPRIQRRAMNAARSNCQL